MRRTIVVAMVCSMSAVACGTGRGIEAEAGGEALEPGVRVNDAPVAVVRSPHPAADAPSSGGSDAGAPASSSDSNPYGPAGAAGCSFGVTGAVLAWVDNSTTWAWAWSGGFINCEGTVDGIQHGVSFTLGELTSPGTYPGTYSGYQRGWCDAPNNKDCTTQDFESAPRKAGCTAVITEAGVDEGSKIAGTFSCPSLSDPSAATSPSTKARSGPCSSRRPR